jgi:hypothetical protein
MSLFSRKKKLIVSGCSYVDDYAKSQNMESFPIWPDLLAKKLDMECINVGKCAAGNKEIFSNIVDEVVTQKNIGLVIVMWSEFQRVSFYLDRKKSWKSFHPDRDFLTAEWQDQFYDTARDNPLKKEMPYRVSRELKTFGMEGIKGGTYDSIRMMYSFQTICENLDVPYLQVQGCLPIMSKTDNRGQKALCQNILDSCYFDKMNKKTFLGWPIMPQISGFNIDHHLDLIDPDRTTLRISPEDTHPNEEAHEIISEVLYDKYNKIYS